MQQPVPLEHTNVVFCFLFLAIGISLTLLLALVEFFMIGIPRYIRIQKQRRERKKVAAHGVQKGRTGKIK